MRMFFSGLKTGFRAFGLRVNLIVVSSALIIAYVIGIGLVSIVSRIFRKQFLDLGKYQRGSYWIERKQKEDTLESCRKSF